MNVLTSVMNPPLILNVLLQVTLLTAVILLVLQVIKRSANGRYLLAWWGLLAVALIALSSAFMQNRGRLLLPQAVAWIQSQTTREAFVTMQDELAAPTEFVAGGLPVAELDLPLATLFGTAEIQELSSQLRRVAAPLFTALMAAWLLGVVFGMSKLLRSWQQLVVLSSNALPLSDALMRRLRHLCTRLDVSVESIQFHSSDRISTPALTGFTTPRILFPTVVLEQATDQQLQAVLVHELAHWRRHDNLANLIQTLITTVFWFHPLVRMLDRIAARSREEICDNYVLQQQDAVSYAETLLWIGTVRSGQQPLPGDFAIAMMDQNWQLQHRISDLIDEKRETTMKLSGITGNAIRLALIVAGMSLASTVFIPIADNAEAQAPQAGPAGQNNQPLQTATLPAPEARTAQALSEEVMEAVSRIQELMTARGDGVEEVVTDEQRRRQVMANIEESKRLLDELYQTHYPSANAFEKATILNFYTNYYLRMEDYPAALETFERILSIDDLRGDIELRTLRSLGQLYAAEEQWQESIDNYQRWRTLSAGEDDLVFRGLSYANYQLEQWEPARDFWLNYLEMKEDADETRTDLAYLNGLYFSLEDYDAALQLTREMILKFNQEVDWSNLRAIHQRLDDQGVVEGLEMDLGSVLTGDGRPEIAFANVVPTDGDYLPLLAVAPMYPTRAADAGIEGWVLVRFTVNEQGDVDEESLEVIDADPPEVFDRNSLRAAGRFKFAPRMVNGEPVAVPGVQYLFRFQLRDDDA